MTRQATAPVRRIVVVLNPKAGRGQGAKQRQELERLLTEASAKATDVNGVDITWEIQETRAHGEGTRLASEAVSSGAEIVAAAGGDGTLGEVVNGIMGTGATLGILPVGTGNDFARAVGLSPNNLPQAVQSLLFGQPSAIDLGRVSMHDGGGRWFINIAGGGFDAVVAERVNRGFRFLHGTSAYLAAIVHSLAAFRPALLRLTLDDKPETECRAMLCVIANAPMYGGGMKVAPDARIDDGLFDVMVLGALGRVAFLRAFPRVFAGTHISHPAVTVYRARRVRLESDPPLPLLIDGDVLTTTPADFTLHPSALMMQSSHGSQG